MSKKLVKKPKNNTDAAKRKAEKDAAIARRKARKEKDSRNGV